MKICRSLTFIDMDNLLFSWWADIIKLSEQNLLHDSQSVGECRLFQRLEESKIDVRDYLEVSSGWKWLHWYGLLKISVKVEHDGQIWWQWQYQRKGLRYSQWLWTLSISMTTGRGKTSSLTTDRNHHCVYGSVQPHILSLRKFIRIIGDEK